MARISVSSEADVVGAVRAARESRRTMEIVGHGTKRGLGRPVECDDVLDLSGLRGILKYEPDEMVITALAGTPIAEIESALAGKNQRLGFEPADWGPLYGASANSASIGGVLAASCDGSAAIRYGRCRDHLLGFRAVNGFGEAYKAGGRVVKNVTGFDLPKLMCGAMGTLGPMTEVTLRAFPKAPVVRGYYVNGVSEEHGFALLRKVWQSPVEATGLVLLSEESLHYFPQLERTEELVYGRDESGDEDDWTINNCAALFRLEGTEASLADKLSYLTQIVAPFHIAEALRSIDLFRTLNSGTAFVDTLEDVWLIRLAPAAMADLASRNIGSWVADWAGGRLWNRSTSGTCRKWFDENTARLGGGATLIRASDETRKRVAPFTPEPPARAELTKRVKAAFDPLRLFNPGRMWDGV